MDINLNDVSQLVKDGGDIVTYLLIYIAYKVHDNGKRLDDHERRIAAIEP